MTTWAIGDLHGCCREFETLLDKIDFQPGRDRLWLTGDLINRGPESLECLRLVHSLDEHVEVVLGNHDFHLLVVAHGHGREKRGDTLRPILDAPDGEELMDWLRRQPLLVQQTFDIDRTRGREATVMTHAGLLPQWSLDHAAALARETEAVLRSDTFFELLPELYGNEPALFEETLTGWSRLRSLINIFARMRFIDAEGRLDFSAKEGLDSAPEGFLPWFSYPRQDNLRLIFGHWAALEGRTPGARIDVRALDTGCVWGRSLTALDMETEDTISVSSRDGESS
ncbi:symmetrical bis(5'-nucleosyl)-tetraphosphatase [Kushneria phosphatilytica]|uniref:bis(5'-nucleosyl)-tetraphosphatase (symmetrical) n=1 Tax=Kushneria phosphatilytica TaxID=657387 RepID=A0A1S1NYI7_9GAMM|nr:symmetrical bis(5'-nucleosyl)-tetraphosphatase [Kushneria phosphatilytica]OHV12741.1 bis(5'-nucleosyl)-tetraphosphatase (symmetrical) [Kushneria phosphatilytica]QEL10582.1 symmetrical bis(5'-nucleosyl)-tetraphosphatase [Kushneria phosphatilytica]